MLGLAAQQAHRSTLAFYISSGASATNSFESGIVDLAGTYSGSTASSLPTTAFSWSSSGTSGDCATLLPGTVIANQAMAPGSYCVHPITLHNTNLLSADAWLRMRLVRQTPAGSAAADALNNLLRVYMAEYSAGSGRTAAQYQTDDCTAAAFRPVPPVAGTAKSTATIANVTSAVTGNRTALGTLGQGGKNFGSHPGTSLPADAAVTALAGSGLGLGGGTGFGPAEATMVTDPAVPASYNAFNLVGNDEITNPRRISDTNVSNGTRSGGSNAEAEILARSSRYYCVAIFYPSDTDLTVSNGAGDNLAQSGNVAYHLVVGASQKAGRTVN